MSTERRHRRTMARLCREEVREVLGCVRYGAGTIDELRKCWRGYRAAMRRLRFARGCR